MLDSCSIISLNKITSSVHFKKTLEKCSENFQYINWLNLHYKGVNKNYSILILLIIIIIPLCFINIKYIAENFFALSINKIKKEFKIPPVIAACTILPFVNGTPDLMVSIASSKIKNGINIIIGSLLGSFIFSSSFIICFIIYYSKKLIVDKLAFLKDLFFYFFALTTLLLFGFLKDLNFFYSLFFFFVYFFYLAISFFFFSTTEDKNHTDDLEKLYFKGDLSNKDFNHFRKSDNQIFKRIQNQTMNLDTSIKSEVNLFIKKKDESMNEISNNKEFLDVENNNEFIKEIGKAKKNKIDFEFKNKKIKNLDDIDHIKIHNNKDGNKNLNNNIDNDKNESNKYINIEEDYLEKTRNNKLGSNDSIDDIDLINIIDVKNIFDEKNQFSLKKTLKSLCDEDNFILNYILFIFKTIYIFSVPHEKNSLLETFSKYIIIFSSFLSSYFLFGNLKKVIIVSLTLTLFLFILFQIEKIYYKRKIIYNFLTIFSSICFINFFTTILLENIFYISFLLNINKTFLSMIVISIGNCIGDLFSGIALAKLGDGLIAFLSTFSGQIFNVYMGIAINMIISKNYHFSIFEGQDYFLVKYLFVFSYGVMFLHLVYGFGFGFYYGRGFFWIGFLYFLAFFGFMVAVLIFN